MWVEGRALVLWAVLGVVIGGEEGGSSSLTTLKNSNHGDGEEVLIGENVQVSLVYLLCVFILCLFSCFLYLCLFGSSVFVAVCHSAPVCVCLFFCHSCLSIAVTLPPFPLSSPFLRPLPHVTSSYTPQSYNLLDAAPSYADPNLLRAVMHQAEQADFR